MFSDIMVNWRKMFHSAVLLMLVINCVQPAPSNDRKRFEDPPEDDERGDRRPGIEDGSGDDSGSREIIPGREEESTDPEAHVRLYARSFYLAVDDSGKVFGSSEKNKQTLFRLISLKPDSQGNTAEERLGSVLGHLRIKSHQGFYIAMDSEGRLTTTESDTGKETVFLEEPYIRKGSGHWQGYYTYLNKSPWSEDTFYLGIKKNGSPKNGRDTEKDQKAVHFLKITVE